jgi:hypothetical protein
MKTRQITSLASSKKDHLLGEERESSFSVLLGQQKAEVG